MKEPRGDEEIGISGREDDIDDEGRCHIWMEEACEPHMDLDETHKRRIASVESISRKT